jgi:O-antigen/teichoic acid export membrane protein
VTSVGRATAVGAAWSYGGQASTVLVQLGYAALTSRLLGPEAFGQYSVALVVAALVTLLATAGLPQSVGRMHRLEGARLSGLLGYAATVGFLSAALLYLTAGFWSAFWGVQGSDDLLRVVAVGALFTPALALGTGLLLRLGRFRALAGVTLTCNVVGMAVGLAAIYTIRTPVMLVVSPVAAQTCAALVCLFLTRRQFGGSPRREDLARDVGYSLRLTGSAALSFIAGNIGKFAVGRLFGALMLGHWNRAEVLTAVPFFQVQNALVQALNPEFRHDIGSVQRAQRVWADLLGLVAWICLPVGSVLAAVSPVVVDLLFGPGWSTVRDLTPVLALVAALQALTYVLVGALEVLARFEWIWVGHALAIFVNAVGGLWAWRSGSVVPILAGALAAWALVHSLHLWLCGRTGLLQIRNLARHYAAVTVFSIVAGALSFAVVHVPELTRERAWYPIALGVVLTACGALAWQLRDRLPPLVLARKYGVIG